MPRDKFLQRKESVLSKLDKSSKGKWDSKVKNLCNKINSLDNFYTTSSCSGRIILMIDQKKKGSSLFLKIWHDKISFKELEDALKSLKKEKKAVKFKFEPPIIHLACKSLEDASKIIAEAKISGFKSGGIITWGKNIFVELNSTEKLEFPVSVKGEILVNDKFLKLVIKISNQKFEEGWKKIDKLEKKIK